MKRNNYRYFKKCESCGGEFYITECHMRRGRGRFCSTECFKKWHCAPIGERILRHAERRESGCIEWTALCNDQGYGIIQDKSSGKRVQHLAHRIAWQSANGEIPEGMCILHQCDNPKCINVEHLFVGSRADNNRDKISKKREACGEKCKQKLTNEKVIEIRHRYSKGNITYRELADMFSVQPLAIAQVVTRKAWKHI